MDGQDAKLKPGFALSLSMDGIVLLHRAAGGWRRVGAVGLDAVDLSAELAELRAKGAQLETGPATCKLIIPNEQIRYLSVDIGDIDPLFRERMVMQALDEATPYTLDELAFDLSEEGDLIHIAAVAHETLHEAESFATDHGFEPVSFVAIPGEHAFLGEPYFGHTGRVAEGSVEPDGIAVVEIGLAEFPAEEPAPDPEPSPAETEGPAKQDAADPVPGFSSRRRKAAPPPSPDETEVREKETPVQAPAIEKQASDLQAPDLTAPPKAPAAPAALRTPPPSETVNPVAKPIAAPEQTQGFSSRSAPAPDAQPAPSHPPLTALQNRPDKPPKTAKPAKRQPAQDESSRMTVFGARKPPKVGGKPKYLGLILTTLLVLIMFAAAAFATLGGGDLVSRIFGTRSEVSDALSEPAPAATPAPVPAPKNPALTTAPEAPPSTAAPLPEDLISALPAPVPVPETGGTTDLGATDNLSATDNAVLDALRAPDPAEAADPSTDPEQLADGLITPGEVLELDDAANPLSPPDPADPALYAATGIWSAAPEQPDTPAVIGLDDLYIASIDRTDLSQDAVALPPLSDVVADLELGAVSDPAAAGTVFELDDQGLVEATPEGTLNPEGVLVFLGKPPIVPPPTPERENIEEEVNEALDRLATLRPKARPADLSEQAERAQLGGLSRSELADVRPRQRPQSVQQQAQARQASETEPSEPKFRLASSSKPRARPSNIAQIAERARKNSANVPSLATASASTATVLTTPAATVTPSIPSSTSVARQATIDNALNLRRVNLIGVYGTPSDRRALVRLSSGAYRKVKVGDRIDGGTVVAIGDSELRYQKSGRNLTLRLPNG